MWHCCSEVLPVLTMGMTYGGQVNLAVFLCISTFGGGILSKHELQLAIPISGSSQSGCFNISSCSRNEINKKRVNYIGMLIFVRFWWMFSILKGRISWFGFWTFLTFLHNDTISRDQKKSCHQNCSPALAFHTKLCTKLVLFKSLFTL